MTRDEVKKLIETYGKAWETKDPDLAVSIFTEDATYDDPHEPLNSGKEAIRQYWIKKVIGEQDQIEFHLRDFWIDRDTVIAEWDATFVDVKRNMRVDMTEVAIFEMRDSKFSSLREYYKTKKVVL